MKTLGLFLSLLGLCGGVTALCLILSDRVDYRTADPITRIIKRSVLLVLCEILLLLSWLGGIIWIDSIL